MGTVYGIEHGGTPALEARSVSVAYRSQVAIHDISISIPRNSIVALIGPSGCGKSTLLRCFNRMNDLVRGASVSGDVLLNGISIDGGNADAAEVRRRVGMIFQHPNPFPKSILDNTVFGAKLSGYDGDYQRLAEQALRRVGLWQEVQHRLEDSAYSLSSGQQQRLCIARALAVGPDVVLMDEPASSLDPVATDQVERLIYDLKREYTVVVVTHNMQQAARISDYTAFLLNGELVEYGPTDVVFTSPREERTEAYVTGRFG
jgi:phosphate transport system ATP-binding protein